MFREKNDRIFYNNKREATWRKKYFNQAIKLLKKDKNVSALKKCEKDLKEFNKRDKL